MGDDYNGRNDSREYVAAGDSGWGKGIWDCVFISRINVDSTVGSDIERGIRVWASRREYNWVVNAENPARGFLEDAQDPDEAVANRYENV